MIPWTQKVVEIGGVVWKECYSWPGYLCNEAGRVLSPNGKLLTQRKNRIGYMKIGKVQGREFKKKAQSVHRMVADAWLGVCPKGREVNHKDHNKENNHAGNLEYVTHKANIRKARDAGRFPDMSGANSCMYGKRASVATRSKMSLAKRGDNHWRAKRPDVQRIKAMVAEGFTTEKVAKSLGVSRTVVGDVLRGTHWSVRTEYVDRAFPVDVGPCV